VANVPSAPAVSSCVTASPALCAAAAVDSAPRVNDDNVSPDRAPTMMISVPITILKLPVAGNAAPWPDCNTSDTAPLVIPAFRFPVALFANLLGD
jgi:hypothetical protein